MEGYSLEVILLSVMITIFFYSLFPLLFVALRKKPITRKKYRVISFIVNLFVMVLFIVVAGSSTGIPYFLWTTVFTGVGVKILENRGILSDKGQYVKQTVVSTAPPIIKLKESYKASHKEMCKLLSRVKIVQNSQYEVAVYLYYIAYFFLNHLGHSTSEVEKRLLPLVKKKCSESWQEAAINSHLRLYEDVSAGRIPVLGAWLLGELKEDNEADPIIRIHILLGDLLVYPECADDYEYCAFPIIDISQKSLFAKTFMSDGYKDILSNYLNALVEYTRSL